MGEVQLQTIDGDREPVTLRYEDERRGLTRRRMRTGCLLAVAVAPLCGIMDYLLYPQLLPALLSLRAFSVVLSALALVLVDSSIGRQFPYALCHLLCLGLAVANAAVPVLLMGYAIPYYVAFIILILAVALLLPVRPSQVSALIVSLLVLYVSAALFHGHIDNWAAFACNAFFVATSIGIALVSMGVGEQLRRREFEGRVALQEAYRNKSRLGAVLAEKSARLESLNQEMEDLLYVASHDLRAPLINVQGFSREMQIGLGALHKGNGRSPEANAALADTEESLQFILTAVARMDALITSLLNVSRIVTRTNPTEQVDLQKLAQKVSDSLHYQLAEKRIEVEFDPLPVVTGDSVQLGRLFGNLIDNAIKYMGTTPERRIRVGARTEAGECRLFVQDSGPGIRKEDQEHVFRLFRRLANGDCPGEGIGLTIVRKIVEKHGGRIWVDSAPGAGSTFWFTLQNTPYAEIGGRQ
jgi:signal transduction histidine kinase